MKCWKGLGGFVSTLDRSMSRSGNRDHIQATLGKVRCRVSLVWVSRHSAFVGGAEWLNSTMRLNGAFWMAIDNIRE